MSGERGRRERGREGDVASRRSSRFWLLVLLALVALAIASPFVYRRYFMTPEGKARMEEDAEKLKQKLVDIREQAEERIPTELEELEALAEKLKQKAGTVHEEAMEELRERGLTPAELKAKIDELRRKLAK